MENLRGQKNYEKEIEELKLAMKETSNERMYRRYNALLMHYEGIKNKKIAELLGLEEHAIGKYIRLYKSKGLTGLEIGHSTGAKLKLSKAQVERLISVLTERTPSDCGFVDEKKWTIELIRQLAIKEFDITMSHRGMAEVIYRNSINYRPTKIKDGSSKLERISRE